MSLQLWLLKWNLIKFNKRMALPGGGVLANTNIPPSPIRYGGTVSNQWKGEIPGDARTHMEGDKEDMFAL